MTVRQFQWDRHVNSVGPISLGLGHNVISVGRLHKLGWTNFGNKLTESWSGILGGTNSLLSVGPKRYKKETGSLHCRLGGTDRSSRLDRNDTKGNREFATPSSVRPRSLLARLK